MSVNVDEFTGGNLKKANYASNPLNDGTHQNKQVKRVPLTTMNRNALDGIAGLGNKEKDRCKNFFALGLVFWMYDRSLETTLEWIQDKFGKKPEVAEANTRSLKAGFNYGETTEAFSHRVLVPRVEDVPAGTYRKITGNAAAAMGLLTAAHLANKTLFYGSYPITPASDILHELASRKNFDVRTFQAEDEIAAIGATLGAAFGGALVLSGSCGPGSCLKS